MKRYALKSRTISKGFFYLFLCGIGWMAQAEINLDDVLVPDNSDDLGVLVPDNSNLNVAVLDNGNLNVAVLDNGNLNVADNNQPAPDVLNSGEQETPKFKTDSNFMTITLDEENSHICAHCTLSELLKQPELFFRSLELENNSKEVNLADHQFQQLSIKLFGAYSSDLKQEGDYILTIGMKKQAPLLGHQLNNKTDSLARENIKAGYVGFTKNTTPFSYRVNVRVHDPMENVGERDLAWSGVASYRIVQSPSHDVFLKGGIGSDSATYLMDPLRIKSKFLSTVLFDDNSFPQDKDEEYLTYEVGLRIERNRDVFLDISAFETNITDKNKRLLYVESGDPKHIASIQGVEVKAGFLLESLEGGARYIYADSDEESFRGDQLIRHLGSLRLGYSPTPRLFLGTVWTRRGEDLFNSVQPSLDVLDIYSFYNIDDKTRWGLVLQNVTDETYENNNIRYERDILFRERDRTLWLRLEIQQ